MTLHCIIKGLFGALAITLHSAKAAPAEELLTRPAARCDNTTFNGRLPAFATVVSVHTENDFYMRATNISNLCSVTVAVKPVGSTNTFNFEVWLPPKNRWNFRFLTVGNFGFSGGLHRSDMVPGAANGFATMTTDTGHTNPDTTNMAFALDPDKQYDWGVRAMNYSVSIAKDVINAFYQVDKPNRSYYSGCSTGGRQGLKQIMVDPNSFDGILVGAPGWDFKHMLPRMAQLGDYNIQATQKIADPTGSLFTALNRFVISQCDIVGTDDVADNIVSDPEACNRTMNWNSPAIHCPNDTPGPQCLTTEQAGVIRKLTSDGYVDGNFLLEGFTVSAAWTLGVYILGNVPTTYDLEYVRNFLGHSDWTWANNSRDIMAAALSDAQRLANNATADDFALPGYRGKIMMYHGLNDGVITAKASRRFWNEVKSRRGGQIQDFFRYFEVPGMQHCANTFQEMISGANAPWYLGGAGFNETYFTPAPPVQYNNSANNALLALVNWVEKSTAPASLNVTSFQVGTFNRAKSRLACPFPQIPKLVTRTKPDDASSWKCV
jgi:feruloyl esterase